MIEDQRTVTVSGRLSPLVVTQALSAFNNNQLRGAMLTLLGLGKLRAFGLAPETIVAMSTLLIVTPIFLLSLIAGRLADHLPKTTLIRICKALELVVFLAIAFALVRENGELLLISLLLAGIETAIFGPVKLGILPEIVGPDRLLSANAWMSATNTFAILLGLIVGSLLLFFPGGVQMVAAMGVLVAIAGLICAFAIGGPRGGAPVVSERPQNLVHDLRDIHALFRAVPSLRLPLIGRSWFWYQGAITTSLMPLLPGAMPGQSPAFVSVVFVLTAAGFCLGAFASRLLSTTHGRDLPVLAALFACIALPSLDIVFAVSANQPSRVLLDIFVLSAGTGVFVVPQNTVLQSETPNVFRARLIGAGDTLSGLAMMCSGVTILGLEALSVPMPAMFMITGLITAVIAVVTVYPVLPALRALRLRRGRQSFTSKPFVPADL